MEALGYSIVDFLKLQMTIKSNFLLLPASAGSAKVMAICLGGVNGQGSLKHKIGLRGKNFCGWMFTTVVTWVGIDSTLTKEDFIGNGIYH